MTDKPNEKKDQPPPDPKRPHATLDLKATEMKSGGSPQPEVSGGASGAKGQGAANAESSAQKAAPAGQRTPSAFTRIVTHLAAGLAGGTVVLFGGDRLAQMIGVPAPGAVIEQRAVDLDKRIAALEAAPKEDAYALLRSAEDRLAKIDTLASELEAARAERTKLSERIDGLSTTLGAQQALETRIAGLEDQLKTLTAAAQSDTGGNRISDIAAVTSRISESEARFSGEVSKLRDTIAREIDDRLNVREDAAKSDLARLAQSMEKLKADQARLDKSVQAAQEEAGRVASAVGELKSTVEQQSQTFAKTTDVAAAVSPVTGLVAKIEGSLDSVLQKENERRAHTERIVTALELGNLKRAIEAGEEFADELDAVNASAGGRLDLKPLEPFKTSGVPSLSQLKEEARPALLSALDSAAVEPDASVWDRLLASAATVVRVRRIDAPEGDQSAEATVARIEKAMQENRLADVLAEARKLPPEALAKMKPWTDKVAARHSVDEAIATVENELKAALTAPVAGAPDGGNE